MIDTHSHLLPWVDHGSPDMDTSLLMARAAAESGIRTVVCTPHLHEDDPKAVESVRGVMEETRSALAEAGIDLELRLGYEVDLSIAMGAGIDRLRELTVEGAHGVILVEMPYHGWPPFLEQTVFNLATGGLRPVIAHPERNDQVQGSPEVLAGCLKAGAVAQATAASLAGEFGRAPGRALRTMLERGYVSLLASDAHAYRSGEWTLGPVLESLRGRVSDETLNVLVDENPRRLLAGEPLMAVRSEGGRHKGR